MKVLIDTNILVYAWDSAEPDKQSKAIAIMQQHRKHACLSVQNLSEFSSVMLRKGSDLKWLHETIYIYSKIMTICALREEHVEHALRAVDQYKMSFWDAQIWAVALMNRIPVILSEDGPTGQKIEGIEFQNPLKDRDPNRTF